MKFSLLLPALLLAARICAQDSSAVTQPLKNVGLFAGAGYAWLDLDAGPLDTADSLMQTGTVTGFGSPGISV
ncbi:MAG: hypothetical protein JNM00_02880, partial [Flavobacteriales bacterium]|nr:hypothetical protein [Flavobacteriales bacterium]